MLSPRRIAGRGGWLAQHWPAAVAIAVVAAAVSGTAVYFATAASDDPDPVVAAAPTSAPAPRVVIREEAAAEETGDLGFPAFATKNTTRVAGADAIADAAAVALAVFPSTGEVPGPAAVSLVDADDWTAGIAAASLTAPPVRAPVLLTDSGEVPELTAEALRTLAPEGSKATGGKQAFALGAAALPSELEGDMLDGDPAEVAAAAARTRLRLAGKPEHVLLVGDDDPALAMPAASWAARSGDPVLLLERDAVPEATAEVLKELEGVPAYVLAPESAVTEKTLAQVGKLAPTVSRIGAEDPVANAIEFARYAAGSFGWDINDPGHGLVIASTERPLDAAAAAPLSASGTWGPLLLTDDSGALPEALHEYLLDLKPGYLDDPTRAVYNHAWIIGDTDALSVELQAKVDDLAELAQVTSGSGPALPSPGATESQPDEPADGGGGKPKPDRDR